MDFEAANIDEVNRAMDLEYERVRDFVALHYHATERDDTPLWNYVRNMPIPIRSRTSCGCGASAGMWSSTRTACSSIRAGHAVYIGQRIVPGRYDPRVDHRSVDEIRTLLEHIRGAVDHAADVMPTHQSFLDGSGSMIPAGAA